MHGVLRFIGTILIACMLLIDANAADKCKVTPPEPDLSPRYASGECVPAADIGLGGFYIVHANPDSGNKSSKSNLLRSVPPNNQIGPWTATGLRTVSRPNQEGDRGKLKVYIKGEWGPWGAIPKEHKCVKSNCECTLENCKPGIGLGVCLPNGKKVVESRHDGKAPCLLRDGVGLYGLISLDGNNPNDPTFAGSTPASSFRTFHMKVNGKDQNGSYFMMDNTKTCDKTGKCTTDTKGGVPYIPKGEIYIKIVDSYYPDNIGYYSVLFVDGIISGKGFIEEAITIVETTIGQVTKNLYNGILQNGFVEIAKAVLLLYLVLTALLFSIGMIKMSQSELIVRVFKIGLIVTLISPMSYDFFYNNLFQLFDKGSKAISSVIAHSTIMRHSSAFPITMSGETNVLTLMDSILKVIVSGVLWKKTLALLFSQYWFFFFGILLGLFIMLIAIIRSLVLYLVAIFVMALLLVLAPFFILMVLFKVTGAMFDDWLKQLISAAMTIIIITLIMLLMVVIIGEQIYSMLHFSICWEPIADWGIFGKIHWFVVKDDISKTMTAARFCGYIINIVLFYNIIDYVPVLVDSLSAAARRPISEAFNIAENRLHGMYQKYVAQNLGEYLSALPYRGYRSIDFAIERATRGKYGVRGEGYKPIKRMLKTFDWLSEKTDKFDEGLRKKFGHGPSITGIEELEREQLQKTQQGKYYGTEAAEAAILQGVFKSKQSSLKGIFHKKTFNIFND